MLQVIENTKEFLLNYWQGLKYIGLVELLLEVIGPAVGVSGIVIAILIAVGILHVALFGLPIFGLIVAAGIAIPLAFLMLHAKVNAKDKDKYAWLDSIRYYLRTFHPKNFKRGFSQLSPADFLLKAFGPGLAVGVITTALMFHFGVVSLPFIAGVLLPLPVAAVIIGLPVIAVLTWILISKRANPQHARKVNFKTLFHVLTHPHRWLKWAYQSPLREWVLNVFGPATATGGLLLAILLLSGVSSVAGLPAVLFVLLAVSVPVMGVLFVVQMAKMRAVEELPFQQQPVSNEPSVDEESSSDDGWEKLKASHSKPAALRPVFETLKAQAAEPFKMGDRLKTNDAYCAAIGIFETSSKYERVHVVQTKKQGFFEFARVYRDTTNGQLTVVHYPAQDRDASSPEHPEMPLGELIQTVEETLENAFDANQLKSAKRLYPVAEKKKILGKQIQHFVFVKAEPNKKRQLHVQLQDSIRRRSYPSEAVVTTVAGSLVTHAGYDAEKQPLPQHTGQQSILNNWQCGFFTLEAIRREADGEEFDRGFKVKSHFTETAVYYGAGVQAVLDYAQAELGEENEENDEGSSDKSADKDGKGKEKKEHENGNESDQNDVIREAAVASSIAPPKLPERLTTEQLYCAAIGVYEDSDRYEQKHVVGAPRGSGCSEYARLYWDTHEKQYVVVYYPTSPQFLGELIERVNGALHNANYTTQKLLYAKRFFPIIKTGRPVLLKVYSLRRNVFYGVYDPKKGSKDDFRAIYEAVNNSAVVTTHPVKPTVGNAKKSKTSHAVFKLIQKDAQARGSDDEKTVGQCFQTGFKAVRKYLTEPQKNRNYATIGSTLLEVDGDDFYDEYSDSGEGSGSYNSLQWSGAPALTSDDDADLGLSYKSYQSD